MRRWLTVLPKRFSVIERFNHWFAAASARAGQRTMEIGAGRGAHLAFENLDEQDYHCVEYREAVAADLRAAYPKTTVLVADCQKPLPYPAASFDRVLAVHVLEHLPDLPAAVAEAHRLLKPGGVFSIVIPCDPGLAYWLARKLSAEPLFRKTYRQSYRWFYRREHINSPAEILSVLAAAGFTATRRAFFPLRLPVVPLNLCLGVDYRKN